MAIADIQQEAEFNCAQAAVARMSSKHYRMEGYAEGMLRAVEVLQQHLNAAKIRNAEESKLGDFIEAMLHLIRLTSDVKQIVVSVGLYEELEKRHGEFGAFLRDGWIEVYGVEVYSWATVCTGD